VCRDFAGLCIPGAIGAARELQTLVGRCSGQA
jgi:hypothetical protein